MLYFNQFRVIVNYKAKSITKKDINSLLMKIYPTKETPIKILLNTIMNNYIIITSYCIIV